MPEVIEGATSTNLAGVTASLVLQTVLPSTLAQAGDLTCGSLQEQEEDAAVDPAFYDAAKPWEVDADYRLRAGMDTILFSDQFISTTGNTAVWIGGSSGYTAATLLGSGFVSLNSTNATGAGSYVTYRTCRTFSVYGTFPLLVDFWAQVQSPEGGTNCTTMELGLGLAPYAATASTDGCFFRWSQNGEFYCVILYNSTAIWQSAILEAPSVNAKHQFRIMIGLDTVSFLVDSDEVAVFALDSQLPTPGRALSGSVLVRQYNVAAALPQLYISLRISAVRVSIADGGSRPWSYCAVGQGGMSQQVQTGAGTSIQNTNFANITAPASATLSNTTGGYGNTLLGGQWQFAAVGALETDYALFAFLCPAGTSLIPGKSLYITSVYISAVNMVVAVATTPTILQWALGVNQTAVTLATTETAVANIARRIPLGEQYFAVASPVGKVANPIQVTFDPPVCVASGRYVHIILKVPVGTATGTEIFRGMIGVNGFWE